MDRKNAVFIPRYQLIQNPKGVERLKTLTKHIEWDAKTQGVWIKENSTAHSVAILCGFEIWDRKPIQDGTYDRHGKIT